MGSVVRDVTRAVQNPGRAITDLGRASTQLGTVSYLNPITAAPRLLYDEEQARENEEMALRGPRERYQASLNQGLRGAQAQESVAKQYRDNLGLIQQSMTDQANRGVYGDLANRMAGAKSDANRRGLLGSGISQAKQAQIGAQGAAEYERNRLGAETQSRENMRDLFDKSLQARLNLYDVDYAKSLSDQERMQKALERKNKSYEDFGSGVGSLIGDYYGNRKKA